MSGQDQLFRAVLEQQGSDMPEPLRAALMGMFGGPAGGDTIIEGQANELPEPDPLPRIDLARWKDEAARTERIIDALSAKLEMLACALGACPSCWGASGPCDSCGGDGKGHLGAFLPDPECFDTFVTPVLRAMVSDRPRRCPAPFTPRSVKPTTPPPTDTGEMT